MINTENARTRKTMKNALGMTLGCLDEHKPRPLGTRFIDKYFSGQSNPTSKWLRHKLLIEQSGWNWEQKQCKTYTYDPDGVDEVKKLLNITDGGTQSKHELAVEWVNQEFNIDEVVYNDKSNRLWHPLQNVPRDIRTQYLNQHNMSYQYDIRSAAPTLLHQKSWQYSQGHILETIYDYTYNRNAVRNKLAAETGLPVENIKKLINSMFAGSRLACNDSCAAWELCNKDPAVIKYLQQSPYIISLKADIKQMWEYLRPELPKLETTTKTGKTRTLQMTSANKWNLYFRLERQVLDVIRQYLHDNGVKHLLIHDAFISTQLPTDIQVVEELVFESTGYHISLEESCSNG